MFTLFHTSYSHLKHDAHRTAAAVARAAAPSRRDVHIGLVAAEYGVAHDGLRRIRECEGA